MMARIPATATPTGRQFRCNVMPPRCARMAITAASNTIVQSTHAESSHANPSAGSAIRTNGRAAQCTAHAIEAVIPARSRTSLECISACSIRLPILLGFLNSTQKNLQHASRRPVHESSCFDLGGDHHITSVIRERFAIAWVRHRSHRLILTAEFQYSSAVGNHGKHGQTLRQCSGERI